MNKEEMQLLAFEIIGYAGDCLSLHYEALEKAKQGDYAACEKLKKQAKESMQEAHHRQTDLLSKESQGEDMTLALIMVHAQDHLMNAILAEKLIDELIDLHKKID